MKNSEADQLRLHVQKLRTCALCPNMHRPPVSGGSVRSKVMLIGQAPGEKEPVLGKPFAWTAGKTLFGWFADHCAISEQVFRSSVYMAAVCRCFPGKKPGGGDRVPSPLEIANCAPWLQREVEILEPELVIPVGKLAIAQFIIPGKLEQTVGRRFRVNYCDHALDLIPLPHPSGASPWPRVEPGRSLLQRAMRLIAEHPAFREVRCRRNGL